MLLALPRSNKNPGTRHDSISLVKLTHHAFSVDFPPVPLSLLLHVHLASRVLRVTNWVSNPILPFTGIIAGCCSSGHLSRVLLYPVLQKMHDEFIPEQVRFRCFVDDLVLKVCEGSDAATLSAFVDSFHQVVTDLILGDSRIVNLRR